MTIDITTPDSPGWWIKRCSDKLAGRRDLLVDLYARYEGDAVLPSSLRGAPDTAQRFYRTSRTTFAEMVVKAVLYRLRVAYILTAQDSGETGDAGAWQHWRRAGMVQASKDAMRNALIAGDGYLMAAMRNGVPVVTAEDPRQTVTIHDPVFQSEILAMGKFFHDPVAGADFAYLLRPGRVFVATQKRKSRLDKPVVRFTSGWEWSAAHGGAEGAPLPSGFEAVVPGFRLRNDEGVGEFKRHRDLFDRIDHLVLQGMVIATMQAFRQRAIKVDEQDMPDRDEETGERIDYDDVFSSDPAALWKLPLTAEMWESGAVDTTPILTFVTKELEKAAAVTFTSLSVFTPEGANQSAQGASLVREGQTFKVKDRQDRFGDVFTDVAALIFRMAGAAEAAEAEKIRIGWAPSEWYGLTEKAAAAAQAKAAGVPWRTIMRDVMQYDPEQIQRMETERMDDVALFPVEAAGGAVA